MKRRLLLFFFAITAAMLFYSCDELVYSPVKENYVNVPVPNTQMSINIDNAADTITVAGSMDLTYSVNTMGKIFSKIDVYVDSTLVGTSYDQRHYGYIYSRNYKTGPHKLFLQLWAYSGSGSLADRARAEFIVYTRMWNLYIKNLK